METSGGERRDAKIAVAKVAELMSEKTLAERGHAPLKATGGRLRPVILTDAAGKPARNATVADVMMGLADKMNLTLVAEGKRPLFVKCIDCGVQVRVRTKRGGNLPKRCLRHKREKVREGNLERNRKWREANPEKAREKARKWCKAHPEKGRKQTRKWREANPDKAREKNRKWREANPDKAREQKRKWRKANPEKAREQARELCKVNREKVREQARKWCEANREKVREQARKWREANREKVRERARKSYAEARAKVKKVR